MLCCKLLRAGHIETKPALILAIVVHAAAFPLVNTLFVFFFLANIDVGSHDYPFTERTEIDGKNLLPPGFCSDEKESN